MMKDKTRKKFFEKIDKKDNSLCIEFTKMKMVIHITHAKTHKRIAKEIAIILRSSRIGVFFLFLSFKF